MNQATIILALLATVTACGHSGQDLFLDQTTTALACDAPDERACANDDGLHHHEPEYGDAGARTSAMKPCDDDSECEYGEVCEHRHGPSRCEPKSAADADDHSSADDGTPDQGHGDHSADAGAPCDDSDHDATDDRCGGADHHGGESAADDYADDHGSDDAYAGDRSGSNSGRH